jgi:hypothetical protein
MLEIYRFSPVVLFYWLVAFSVYEWIAISVILAFSKNRFKTPLEYYQDLPSWVAVSGDFIYTTAILLTAQLVFHWIEPYVTKIKAPKLGAFIVLIVLVQWVFDLTFAQGVLALPSSFSKYVNYFQRYIGEVTFGAAISDSIWMVGWLLLTLLFIKYVPLHIGALILSLSLFLWLVVKW